MNALQIAASGMSAQQMRVDVVSNNLANMSTTAYNARRADFADLHYQQVARPGTVTASDGTTTFVSAVDLTSTGVETATVVPKSYPTGGTITVSGGGTAGAAGLAAVVLEYIVENRANESQG